MSKQVIKTLSDRDHVRLRPGNYIYSKSYTVYELVDNSIDEFVSGYGNKISVTINKEGETSVRDYGRGLPVEPSEQYPDKSQAEVAFSSLKSGSKFDTEGAKTSGLNGIGSSGINFLSEYFNVEIYRNNKVYELQFEQGICTKQITEIGTTEETGTLVVAKPDNEIWATLDDYDIPAINRRLKQLAYLNPGLTIEFRCTYNDYDIDESYYYEDGLPEYLNELLGSEEPIADPYRVTKSVPIDEQGNTLDMDIIFAFTNKYYDNIIAFTNNVSNKALKSSNLAGFKQGIAKAIKSIINDSDIKCPYEITSDDTKEGLMAIISIKLFNPFYEGQGKDILNMPVVRSAISDQIEKFLLDRFDKNPNEKDNIISKVMEAASTREAAKRIKETNRKAKTLSIGKVPGLTKANTKDKSLACIWLVEGDSAAGSAKDARDAEVDAILPVFGKINNTYDMSLDKILKSPKLITSIKAIGCGIGDEFDLDNLNYDKVIIMTDADDDGLHIRTLWMTFFYLHMPELIKEGHVYIAQPPLFTVTENPNTKKEKRHYAYNEQEMKEIIASLDCKYEVIRNKGLM